MIAVTETTRVPVEQLKPYPGNARRGDVDKIVESLRKHGQYRALVVNKATMVVLAGNHTMQGIERLEWPDALVDYVDVTEDEGREINLIDNRLNDLSGYDNAALLALIDAAKATEAGLQGTGYTEADAEALREAIAAAAAGAGGQPEKPAGPTLRDRFLVPPFSVLDARQGYWQDRKRQWIALGIQSEVGRGEAPGGSAFPADHIGPDGKFERGDHHAGKGGAFTQPAAVGSGGLSDQLAPRPKVHVAPGGAPMPLDRAKGAGAPRPNGTHGTNEPFGAPYGGGDAWRGRKDAAASFKSQARLAALQTTGSSQPTGDQPQATGTSIFDPTLTELLVRWFSAEGGEVLDPFAGGSVRGIVAAKLGRHYTGIELRPEQVAANEQQRVAICGPDGGPRWICGDSLAEIPKLPADYAADMLLSCPPYFDLEVYSQEAADLSAMDYPGFLQAYRAIIAAAVTRLRDDRFACWVVGEVRDARGIYRNFVGDTIAAFEAAGARYYNEAILVTAVGSLPVRAGRIFETARKLGKSHQNVLVFCKGDPKRAAAACGSAEIVVGEGLFDEGGMVSDEPASDEDEPDAPATPAASPQVPAQPDAAPIVHEHGGVLVVRDDLYVGGTKARYARQLFDQYDEVVYATPAEGMAQVALAASARDAGKRATLFVAKRKERHARTKQAASYGAKIVEVEHGYLNVVQARAREYVGSAGPGVLLAPFGFNLPGAIDAIAAAGRMANVQPDEVWCAAGSGALARGLALAFPDARRHAVQVGHALTAADVAGAEIHVHPRKFAQRGLVAPPFPSDWHYDAKAWEICQEKKGPGVVLFWNVTGPAPED